MTRPQSTSVLICGAGPAGLALAVDLARRGVAFRIVDKRSGPFHGSRGKGIQPRTLEVFEDLGIVDRVLQSGGRYPVQLIHEADGDREEMAIDARPPTAGEPYGEPWMLPQAMTESLLRERLAELGHAVEWASEVVAMTQHDDAVYTELVTSTGNETVQTLYIVGADGGRSAVRKILDIGFSRQNIGRACHRGRSAYRRAGSSLLAPLQRRRQGTATFVMPAARYQPDPVAGSGISRRRHRYVRRRDRSNDRRAQRSCRYPRERR